MSERMIPLPFDRLMERILADCQENHILGVRHIFRADSSKFLYLFGETPETPFGPAAGPHTQLSQNIVAAYAAGARFFELKTVQTLDGEDLPVAKPCIYAPDECYNVEWSTELTVQEALAEYVKAWFALKLISREFGLGDPNGFVFNMSVGYSYEGITSPKIDAFIEGLKNARSTAAWMDCMQWTKANLFRFRRVDNAFLASISDRICTSVTLSTLHGCPPGEIERIAAYLIRKKKLHTFVKCNPTLLGYAFCRRTLDALGYGYISFDDFHFRDDLQYADAVPMFKRLQALADESGLSFGLKLSNTFPVQIKNGELPGEEMYMSGRSLYPLTCEMVRRLSEEFDGRLRLSFSGGADVRFIEDLFAAGVWPVTMATTMLKPGGYDRLSDIASRLYALPYTVFAGISVGKAALLAGKALADPQLIKPVKPGTARKNGKPVPLFSCFTAPCSGGCPIGQDIPEYISLAGEGRFGEALHAILQKNPLPFITGTICPHNCQKRCTRSFYEDSVHIRSVKLLAAQKGKDAVLSTLAPATKRDLKVAVVGGGPGGMAASHILSREGAEVTLFEKHSLPGGIVRYTIPSFRIGEEAVEADASFVEKLGVTLCMGEEAPALPALLENYDSVIYAVGAAKPSSLPLEEGQAMDAVDFLTRVKAGTFDAPCGHVVVAGGGNTAMDTARAALRLPGIKDVRLVYRRTKTEMPAEEEELALALSEGVLFCELVTPVSLGGGRLICERMRPGAPDASGRRRPIPTGEKEVFPCDLLLSAAGMSVCGSFFAKQGLRITEKGTPILDPVTLESSVPNVYVIGDAKAGPATVVEAIADARRAAEAILHLSPASDADASPESCREAARRKQGRIALYTNAERESERCLECRAVCECCVQVCPNRANISIPVPGIAMPVILHLDDLCNECGNCRIFCPYEAAPYRDKLTLYSEKRFFDADTNPGILPVGKGRFLVRTADIRGEVTPDSCPDKNLASVLSTLESEYPHLMK